MAELITGIDDRALTIWFWPWGYISEEIKAPALSFTLLGRDTKNEAMYGERELLKGRVFFRYDQLICASLVRWNLGTGLSEIKEHVILII